MTKTIRKQDYQMIASIIKGYIADMETGEHPLNTIQWDGLVNAFADGLAKQDSTFNRELFIAGLGANDWQA